MSDEKHEKSSETGSGKLDTTTEHVVEVTNADLALALSTGPHLKATSAKSIQLFAILVVAFLGSMSNGFDGQVMSAVNGMQ